MLPALQAQAFPGVTELWSHELYCAHAVSFNGRTHKVQVQPGPEGAKAFEKEIRDMLQLPEEQEFDVSVDERSLCFARKTRLRLRCIKVASRRLPRARG